MLLTRFQEIGVEFHGVGLEHEEGRGTAEGEVAFFLSFFDRLAGSEGLVDRADAGGADFHADDGAEVLGDEFRDGAFVFPEVGKPLAQGERGDGEERAVDHAGFARNAGAGEVVAVVIDRAEAREEKRAVLIFFGEFFAAKETGDVEFLSLHEDRADLAGFFEAEMATVGRKDDRSVGERAGIGSELAVEEVVEGGEFVGLLFEVGRIEAVGVEKGEDLFGGFGLIHALAVPLGEEGAFDKAVQGDFSERVSVGPAEEAFAVDLFGFQLS